MVSFIGIGIVAGLLFGMLSLAAAGKFYYLLWRKKKKRISSRGSSRVFEQMSDVKRGGSGTKCGGCCSGGACLLCWRKASSVHDDASPDLEMGEMGYGMTMKSYEEEGVEADLMSLDNLCGPPRFLFTIKEETLEDLASEDDRTMSRLIDLMRAADDVNILSPMASPMWRSPRSLTSSPMYSNGFLNPLYECSAEAELNRLRSSPPPRFKFLRDAEEKMIRKLREEAERDLGRDNNGGHVQLQPRSCSSEVASIPAHDVHVISS